MKQLTLNFLKVAAISLGAFLCICWVLAIHGDQNASWSESIWFFGVTYALLQKYRNDAALSMSSAVIAVLLGRLILELPLYLFDFTSVRASLIFTLSSILGILLSAVCYSAKRTSVFLLSVIVLVLYNSFVVPAWFERVFCNF